MLFTSGTSGDPKAVRFAHAMAVLCGASLAERFELTADDVCYLSMPLFHSNGVAAGWAVALACGATMVPAKFSPSRFLPDIRRYGATYMNYVGKPLALVLATPEKPDDADNTLRAAFGNEATERDVDEFARRFGCKVVDSFGSSEFAVVVMREDGCPPGSIGKGYPGVSVYHADTVTECAPAVFDEHGALTNFDEAVGELVNTYGVGGFTGYYNDPAATEERMRHGMYWSGDLAYRDADGWIYLAGRTADWMRVDGENMAAGPIERILQRLPEISLVAVYAVPDERVGDQVMAAVVLNDGATLSPKRVRGLPGSHSPTCRRRRGRGTCASTTSLPQTATNKILKRALIQEGVSAGDGVLWAARSPRAGILGAMTDATATRGLLSHSERPARRNRPGSGIRAAAEGRPVLHLLRQHTARPDSAGHGARDSQHSLPHPGRPDSAEDHAAAVPIDEPDRQADRQRHLRHPAAAPARYDANTVVSIRLRLAEPQ